MEIKTIQELVKNNKTMQDIFFCFSSMERNKKVLNLSNFKRFLRKEKFNVDEKDFINVFTTLKTYKLGEFIYNKNKEPICFKWNEDMKVRELGFLGRGENVQPSTETRKRRRTRGIARLMSTRPLTPKLPATPTLRTVEVKDMLIAIPLTSGKIYKFNVRSDISDQGISDITNVIKQLAK